MWQRLIQFLTETLFRMLAWVFPPVAGPLPKNPKLLLVFSTTGIGDALFDTAAIRSLRIAYPQARIVVCAHRKRTSVMRHDPDVDEVVPYGKAPTYAWRLLWRFRRTRPDLVILLRINEEIVPLGYCINRRALFGGTWKSGRYTHLLSHGVSRDEGAHILRHGTVISEAAGGAGGVMRMNYSVSGAERTGVADRFSTWIEKPFVIFQAGGGKTLSWRDWPVESYIRTVKWLQQVSELNIVITGGWDNEQTASLIEKSCPGVINLCSKTSLEETAALLPMASMLVTTDTGVLHLGYALGCPTLAILHYASPGSLVGPTDLSVGHEVVELPQPADPGAPRHGAMKNIPDEEVRQAILRILKRNGIPVLGSS